MTRPATLVVDHDENVAATLRATLAHHDIDIATARDAATAKQLLDEGCFCGLVLDLEDGMDVLSHVASRRMTIPTVLVTNTLPPAARELFVDEHVKLVFPKSVEPRVLASVVLGLCGIAA
ncbi:MAG TPA: response regulator [Thermoanaerobaculia bacterium]|jgi:DNA-binding NtrC family response regulator